MSAPLTLRGLGPADIAGGILVRADAENAATATRVLAEAEAEAARIHAAAEEVYESERARGLAEGRAEAAREAAARLVAEGAALDAALAATEAQLAALVSGAVRRLIGDLGDAEAVRRTVRTALDAIRTEKQARLHVAPAAVAAAREAVAAARADLPAVDFIDVVEDPALSASDLRLESDLGIVQFVLDDTLADLTALLTGRR